MENLSAKNIASAFLNDLARLLEHHSVSDFGLELVGGLVVANKHTGDARVLPIVFIGRTNDAADDAAHTRSIFTEVVEVLAQNAHNYDFKMQPPPPKTE
jgi:hypothetical protein